MAIDKEIGKRIKVLRTQKDWSQEDLANKSKIKQATISYIESGTRNINKDNLLAISKALGVNPDYLLNGSVKVSDSQRLNDLEKQVKELRDRLDKVIDILAKETNGS